MPKTIAILHAPHSQQVTILDITEYRVADSTQVLSLRPVVAIAVLFGLLNLCVR
jgi:hypothetical protein